MALLKEIDERRSRKTFRDSGSDGKDSISAEQLQELIRAAQRSPSCFNNQPGRFIVLAGEGCEMIHPALSRGNTWAKDAPAIIAIASHADLDCRITGRDYFMLGIGLQLENLILQAVHRGLFAHPIAGFNENIVKEALEIPDEYRVPVLVVIGHPNPDEELADKGRKPIGEVAFSNKWGIPLIDDSMEK